MYVDGVTASGTKKEIIKKKVLRDLGNIYVFVGLIASVLMTAYTCNVYHRKFVMAYDVIAKHMPIYSNESIDPAIFLDALT